MAAILGLGITYQELIINSIQFDKICKIIMENKESLKQTQNLTLLGTSIISA